jgi:uncharacterized protein YerC
LEDISSKRITSAVQTFSKDVLTLEDTATCLAIYLDILLIIDKVGLSSIN